MGNKADELKCLDIAIGKCLKQRGDSKQIAKLLSGNDVKRNTDESPDFVRYCPPRNKNEKGIVIGIEHFRVDHYSKELKNNRVGSFGKVYENGIKKTVDIWKDTIGTTSEIPQDALLDVGNLLNKHLELYLESTYNSFVEAFRYSLEKHIKSIDSYYLSMDNLNNESMKQLAFLIEIHTSLKWLFYHDNKGVVRHNDKTIPMFDEVVSLLEEVDYKKVQYIILCFCETFLDKNAQIIAVKTRNVRHQLEKRNVTIYNYAGHDMFLNGFQRQVENLKVNTQITEINNSRMCKFNTSVQYQKPDNNAMVKTIMKAYKIAHAFKMNKQPFAVTEFVEMFLVIHDKCFNILFDNNGEPDLETLHNLYKINKENFDKEYESFIERYYGGVND